MNRIVFISLMIMLTFSVLYIGAYPFYGGNAYIFPVKYTIKEQRNLIEDYSVAIEKSKELSASALALYDSYKNVREEDEIKLEQMYPQSIDPVRLMSEVDGIISKSLFTPESMSYSHTEATEDTPGLYTLNFVVSGDYGQLKNLIYDLETSQRLFTIKSLTFTSGSRNDDVKYSIRIQAFYKK